MTSERAALHSRRLALASDAPAIGSAAVAALLDLCAAQAAVAWLPVYSDGRPKRIDVFLGGDGVNESNPLETGETSALGRALGMWGFGCYGTGIASAEEVLRVPERPDGSGTGAGRSGGPGEGTNGAGDPAMTGKEIIRAINREQRRGTGRIRG